MVSLFLGELYYFTASRRLISDRHRRAARVRLQYCANRDSGLGWDNQRTKIDRGLSRSGRPDNFDGLFAWALACESHHATARQCIAHRALDQ
jgi:hypothetical protein